MALIGRKECTGLRFTSTDVSTFLGYMSFPSIKEIESAIGWILFGTQEPA